MQRVVDSLKLKDDPEFVPPPSALDWFRSLFSRSGASGTSADDIARARAMDTLQKRLKIVRQRSTFLVDINASSRDRGRAAAIANAVAQAYFMEQVRSKFDATKIAAGWLNQQLDELKSRVAASDKAVQDFRAENNLSVAQGVTINDQQMGDLNSKLVEARTEAAEARAKFEQVDRLAKAGRRLRARSPKRWARRRSRGCGRNMPISPKRTPTFPPSSALVIRSLRPFGPSCVKPESSSVEEIQRILQSRRHIYEVASAREASLQKSLGDLTNISNDSGPAQVRLRELQRQADANRTLYESFLARYKEASAQESLELPDLRVVTPADAPIRPSFPKVPLTLGLALLIGFVLGSLLALVVDYLDRRIKTLRADQGVRPAEYCGPSQRERARAREPGKAGPDRSQPLRSRVRQGFFRPDCSRRCFGMRSRSRCRILRRRSARSGLRSTTSRERGPLR